ncbi:claudin-11a [Trichomycterus rosablanca]|uniref:claudin-11a n=1 Tax=Trichomycterus rosablanca TaxID=2290929 RepID=UPI002F3565A3
MANACLQTTGFLLSFLGWIGLVVATATSDWVVRCKYGMNTCKKMDELETKGLWEQCVVSTALYHCYSLNQILELPVYIQTCRALMITASILGLPAMGLVLSSMPCFQMGEEAQSDKNKRSVIGGILVLVLAVCALVSTVWFPVGAHRELGLMSFGFSLYSGWLGATFSLLGGSILTCCSVDSARSYHHSNRYSYYSKQGPPSNPTPTGTVTNHAKTAHV